MSSTISSTAPASTSITTNPIANLPSQGTIFSSLLKADLTAQWRNRRATIMVMLIPSIVLISWKGLIAQFGGAFALSNCITIGLNAIGLMGYTNSIARDRDKGIFQRLRITPAPRWTIIASRLAVQLLMIIITTLVIFLIGNRYDNITLSAGTYALGLLTAILSGAVYLSLGQMIVGLVKNQETVNVTTRLVFFLFIMVGQFASFGALGKIPSTIASWSPYGVVQNVLSAVFTANGWKSETSMYFMVAIAYIAVFTTIGIRYFRWSTK